jgi:8-oxo-dGTP pyrophosphatase MutT (NUDIX family)
MTESAWRALEAGLAEFFAEEREEDEHAEDADPGIAAGIVFVEPGGQVLLCLRSPTEQNYGNHWSLPGGKADAGETAEDAALREAEEEIGPLPDPTGEMREISQETTPNGMKFHTFVRPVAAKFEPRLNGEHVDYGWFPPGELPENTHPAVAKTLRARAAALAGDRVAHDSIATDEQLAEFRLRAHLALAQDFAEDAPVGGREMDQDGRMRVARVHISKASVNPYKGKEIPGFDPETGTHSLGLDPEKIYWLWRHPEELERGAATSNGVQILKTHKPVDAKDAKQYEVVGSVGTEARFAHPFLDNSITLWTEPDIEGVTSGKKQQLSMGYHYRPDMTPGETPEGEPYDGVMRDIKVNHVALVELGRAGPDVMVADALDELQWAAIAEVLGG